MNVIVKKGVRPSEGKVLSFAEEKAADDRIKELESQLMGKEVQQGLSFEPRDVKTIENWLAHYKKMKANQGAQKFEGTERVSAEMELRRIEDAIRVCWGGRIPNYSELWINQRAGIDYLNLVQKWVKLNANREFHELIRRWKYIRRRMEPEDPNADNILHLYDRKRG